MKRSILGFLTLAAISAYLYVTGLIQSISLGSPAVVPLAVAVLLLAAGYLLEWPSARSAEDPPLDVSDLKVFISVIAGAVASHWLNVTLGLGAVLGAGIVGVLSALLLPDLSAPMYCGAFCGMASTKVLPSIAHLILGSAIAGIIFVMAKETMNGFGGKLGATAASGCIIATLVTGNKMLEAPVPDWATGKYIVPVTVVSAVATYIIGTRFKQGGVMGSGLTSVVGGLFLPALFPEIGSTLAAACACGSYAGMSSEARIPNEGYMAVAGVIAGLMFIWGSPCIGGIGGRLGTTGLGGVIATWSGIQLSKKLRAKQSEIQTDL
ncbi:MAG TPA: hypothetical protein GX729_02840 [Firmicutes bacterium]|nr:hypothetical protein [Bacillota bacterium]